MTNLRKAEQAITDSTDPRLRTIVPTCGSFPGMKSRLQPNCYIDTDTGKRVPRPTS